jgi:hypothetical protein
MTTLLKVHANIPNHTQTTESSATTNQKTNADVEIVGILL